MKKTLTDYIAVGTQGLLFLFFCWQAPFLETGLSTFFRITGVGLIILGAGVCLAGFLALGSSLSVFPSPRRRATLVTHGVFQFIRHPLYTGVLLIAFGWAIHAADPYRFVLSLVLVVFFHAKAGYEESRLRDHFPGYAEYQQRSGRFLPLFGNSASREASPTKEAEEPTPE